MLRVMTVKLYPTPAQESQLFVYLRAGRRVWNHFLENRIKRWKRRQESTSFYEQCRMLTKWRLNSEAMRAVSVDVQRDALRRLDRAFKAFFRRLKTGEKPGFPRFKGANRWDSFEILATANYVTCGKIRVPKLGLIRCRNLRFFEGQQRSLRIIRRANGWYAQILIDDGKLPPPKRPIDTAIGIDLGLKSFIAGSDGSTVDPPKHFRRLERKLKRASRSVSRKRKGSRNRRKAIHRLRRVHQRIADARSDFTHNLSREIVNRFDLIAIEKLNVKGMAQGRLAKSILDAAWSQFTNRLSYKAEDAGGTLVAVNPSGTTQGCSQCGEHVPKDLSVRVHDCPLCGLTLDRDVNAARNVLYRAIEILSSTGGRPEIHACGEEPIGALDEAGSLKHVATH